MCVRVGTTEQAFGYTKTTNYSLATNTQFSLAVKLNIHHPRLVPYISRYR